MKKIFCAALLLSAVCANMTAQVRKPAMHGTKKKASTKAPKAVAPAEPADTNVYFTICGNRANFQAIKEDEFRKQFSEEKCNKFQLETADKKARVVLDSFVFSLIPKKGSGREKARGTVIGNALNQKLWKAFSEAGAGDLILVDEIRYHSAMPKKVPLSLVFGIK